MVLNNTKELFLEDETFDGARQNFNVVMQRLFKSMIDSESEEGSITLKIDVAMKTEFIPNNDPDSDKESRMVLLPAFAHKVTSTVTVKEEMKGAQNPNMELVWDDKSKSYKLQYISNTEQRTIFDKDAAWNQDVEEGQDQEALMTDPDKTWMNVPQLPGEVADEGALPGVVADETALPGEVTDPDEDGYEDFRPAEMPEDEDDADDEYGYEEPEGE